MKKIFLVTLSCICLSAYAQKKKNRDSTSMLMTNGIGVSFQQFTELNNRIASFPQYKGLRDQMWTLTLGSMNVRNRFVSGLNVTGGSSMSGDRGKRSSALRFLSGGIDLGYDLIPADRFMLYPLVGLGAETYRAIFHKDNSFVDFNDVLGSPIAQNNIRSVKFTNSFFTYRLGLGFAVKSPKGSGTVGVQLGYIGSFKENSWKGQENQVFSNSPEDKVSRFQISLIFGNRSNMMR